MLNFEFFTQLHYFMLLMVGTIKDSHQDEYKPVKVNQTGKRVVIKNENDIRDTTAKRNRY